MIPDETTSRDRAKVKTTSVDIAEIAIRRATGYNGDLEYKGEIRK